jgi:hypothetical protein
LNNDVYRYKRLAIWGVGMVSNAPNGFNGVLCAAVGPSSESGFTGFND